MLFSFCKSCFFDFFVVKTCVLSAHFLYTAKKKSKFLFALLVLKIIVNMKGCYVGFFGNIEKCINFAGLLF